MSVNNLKGQNIQDTYQRVVQSNGTNLADGTGSLLPISFDGNNVIISGSLTATEYSVTSSVTNVIFQPQSGSTIFGDSIDDTHVFTGSLLLTGSIATSASISASSFKCGDIETAGRILVDGGGSSTYGELFIGGGDESFMTPHTQSLIAADGNLSITIGGAAGDASSRGKFFEVRDGKNGGGFPFVNTALLFSIGGEGDITGSGNISASGNYTGVSASLDYITTSGNISASGNIIGTIDGGKF